MCTHQSWRGVLPPPFPLPHTKHTRKHLLTTHSSVIPGGQQSAAALKYLSQGTNDHQMTWKIDIEAGMYRSPSVPTGQVLTERRHPGHPQGP